MFGVVTPEDMVDMLRAAGVPWDALVIEPTVSMRAPDDNGWMSVVPRIYSNGEIRWYVTRYSPRERASWLSEHPDPVAAVNHIGALFFTGHLPPPVSERGRPPPGQPGASGGPPWDR